MPPQLLYTIRFGGLVDSTKAIAELFGTTVGKVYDIKKNANFSYISRGYPLYLIPKLGKKIMAISKLTFQNAL